MHVHPISGNFNNGNTSHWVGLVISTGESNVLKTQYINPMGYELPEDIKEQIKQKLGQNTTIESIYNKPNCPQYSEIESNISFVEGVTN